METQVCAQNKTLQKLREAMLTLAASDGELPIGRLLLFLEIAQHQRDGITMAELQDKQGIAQCTASRNVKILSAPITVRGQVEPLEWVEYRRDPRDYRRKILSLSPKGEQVLEDCLGCLK